MPNDGLSKDMSPIFYDSKLQKSAASTGQRKCEGPCLKYD